MTSVTRERAQRPQLSHGAFVRRHIIDGKEKFILQEPARGIVIDLGAREWRVLQCADGTRDSDGVHRAVLRSGLKVSLQHVRDFLETLDGIGLLREGETLPDVLEGEIPTSEALDHAALPIDLIDLRMQCDGRGLCCSTYGTVLFEPTDVFVARAHLPVIRPDHTDVRAVFTPERGNIDDALSAVTSVNGRCLFLNDGGLCDLHAHGGARSKPAGCNLFPVWCIADDEAVRVTAVPECLCVYDSAREQQGEPLFDSSVQRARDLPPSVIVDVLSSELMIVPGVIRGVSWLRATRSAVLEHVSTSDPVSVWWSLADGMEHAATRKDDSLPSFTSVGVRPEVDPCREQLSVFLKRFGKRVSRERGWRSASDNFLRNIRWIEHGIQTLVQGSLDVWERIFTVPVDARTREDERFYLRSVMHGYLFVGDRTLVDSLRDRVLRVLIARAMTLSSVVPEADEHEQPSARARQCALGVLEPISRSLHLEIWRAS